MSTMLFSIKKDDLRPYLQVQFFNPDGTPQDLTGKVVTFTMKGNAGVKVSSAAATMVIAADGIVEYRWTGTDTDTAGSYRAEFEINGIDTYPKETYITVEILADLN